MTEKWINRWNKDINELITSAEQTAVWLEESIPVKRLSYHFRQWMQILIEQQREEKNVTGNN